MEHNLQYQEALKFIAYTKKYGSVLGLDSIRRLLESLENPQDKLKIIHVAGTNGKGSTSSFIAHILASSGYLVGRFNSPAVFEYREMIQLLYLNDGTHIPEEEKHIFKDDKQISKDDKYIIKESIDERVFALLIKKIKTVCDQMVENGLPHPTTFEIETAMALLYLQERQVDFAIVEVGLGGRLDATNIIKNPLCTVITSISMDHTDYLGNTLGEIAKEKAGIIKIGTKVIVIEQEEEIIQVIKSVSESQNAELIIAKKDRISNITNTIDGIQFTWEEDRKNRYSIGLRGEYQIENGLLALEVINAIKGLGYTIEEEAIRLGLEQTQWGGRFEVLSKEPYIIIDGAHNKDAVIKLRNSLMEYFPNKKFVLIMGVLGDKDYTSMLELMAPLAKKIITITPDNPRALSSHQLCETAREYGVEAYDGKTVQGGLEMARSDTSIEDVIVGFGSLSYIGELKHEVSRIIKK